MPISHKASKFGDLARSEKLNRSYLSRLLQPRFPVVAPRKAASAAAMASGVAGGAFDFP
jgi:hypothetical protein